MTEIKNDRSAKVFADLPPEVISIIFTFLPYSDLQTARLVCKEWYKSSIVYNIVDKEKIDFANCHNCEEDLKKSIRDFLHIKVVGDDSIWSTNWFWTRVQPKIRSLLIEGCIIPEDQFLRIIHNCPMLKSLHIEWCDFSGTDQRSETQNDSVSLELCELQSLQSISLSYKPQDQINSFYKLVACAPNLKLVSLSEALQPGMSTSRLLLHHAESLFKRHPERNLKISLSIKLQTNDGSAVKLAVKWATCPFVQIEDLEMSGVIDHWNTGLFKHFPSLQSLEVQSAVDDDGLKVICRELPGIKHLTLQDCSKIVNAIEELASLQNLKTLCLWKCQRISGETILIGLCSRVNRTLKQLILHGLRGVPEKCFVEIAKCHPNITELELVKCCIDSEGIRAIAKFQISLLHLKLEKCENVCDENLYILSQIKGLRRLELTCIEVEGVPFEEGLVFPKLRSICLEETQVSEKSVRCLIKNHENLRGLWVVPFDTANLEDILSTRPYLTWYRK